jgi:hypothetical protein
MLLQSGGSKWIKTCPVLKGYKWFSIGWNLIALPLQDGGIP